MTPHDLLANFEVLAEAPSGIQRLRELVLELAVRGKLVKQDPGDEPASGLLKQIKKEKTRPSAVRTRKSKEPSAQENAETTPPFEVPKGWVWCRLLDVCHRVHYGYTAPSTNDATHIRLVRITDIQNGKVVWEQVPGCDVSTEDASSFILSPRDILIARTGGTIGKTFLVDEVPRPAVFASYLIRAIPCESVDASFLKRFCEAPTYCF
jgi:type I restriction enzyme S subunit